jgi:putative hemolysin
VPIPISLRAALASAAAALCLPAAHAQTSPAPPRPALANPASTNCIDKGGQLVMEKNGAGGQFGVCLFADNLQCEEWAMLRGECRTGGIKVTGFATPAARYCAITGGTYHVTAASNTPDERGTCAFANQATCDAKAYFDGTCSREKVAAATPVPRGAIRAQFTCDGGKSIAATFRNGVQSSVALVLSDGRSLTLPQARSGSGARYANRDESVVFWNKGNTAFLQEKGTTTYEGCATRP